MGTKLGDDGVTATEETDEKTLKFSFTLNPDDTVLVDWHSKVRAMNLPVKKKKATGTFMDVVQKLEATYSGLYTNVDYGYVEDEMFVAPENFTEEEMCDTFYVNSGEIDTRRAYEDYEDSNSEEESEEDEDDEESLQPLAPKVEESVKKLEEAWEEFLEQKNERPTRIPSFLDPYLLKIAQTAQSTNKQKYITREVVRRVFDITGFTEGSVRPRMKELIKRVSNSPDGTLLQSPSESQSLLDLIKNSHQKVIDEIEEVKSAGPEKLHDLKVKYLELLKTAISQLENDVVWTQEIRLLTLSLSYIEDACAKSYPSNSLRQMKNAYYNEICSLWPEGRMNKNKLTGHVAAYRNKLKKNLEGSETPERVKSSPKPVDKNKNPISMFTSNKNTTIQLENLQPPLKITKTP